MISRNKMQMKSALRRSASRLLREIYEVVDPVNDLNAFEELCCQTRRCEPPSTIEIVSEVYEVRSFHLRKLLHEEDLKEAQPQPCAMRLERLRQAPFANRILLEVREPGKPFPSWRRLELPENGTRKKLLNDGLPDV